MDELTITQPDDWHLHLRDGEILAHVLPATARCFARAIVMPNLQPPVTTTAAALAYRERILANVPADMAFTPLMTLYLTEVMPAAEIEQAWASGLVHAVKYYPAGATTHAAQGVRDPWRCTDVFATMERLGMPLLLHGEAIDPEIDIFDREAVFIEKTLQPLLKSFPGLRVVFEHITTRDAVDFVRESTTDIAATITVHHLLLNRNALLVGGVRPHHFCLPVLKRETHRAALVTAATSGSPRFFLGTDSAPHPRHAKESACGCAGIYSAPVALELYAEVFENAGALDRLEDFASHFGADFYRLPRNTTRVTLRKTSWTVPEDFTMGKESVVPLRAGQAVGWQLGNRTE